MADTKALEELNREIVKLVDELSAMQAKQERLKELMRRRAEVEQQLLGVSSEPAPRVGRPRKVERVDEPAAVAAS